MADNFYQHLPGRMEDGRLFTDFRMADRRELHNMSINGIKNEHELRRFYQRNGAKIADSQWKLLKRKNTKPQKICYHNYPTRSTPGMLHDEMKRYTAVSTGKSNDAPQCRGHCDYRLTQTPESEKNCSDVACTN